MTPTTNLRPGQACFALTTCLLLAANETRGDQPSLQHSIRVDQGVPTLQINGPADQWVLVEARPSLSSSTPWQTLSYLKLGASTASFADDPASAKQARFFRVSTTASSPSSPATFLMGSPPDEEGRDNDEAPQTLVTLNHQFWLSPHEVTQGEFSAVMGTNPSAWTGDPALPVEQVSWNDAQAYCQQRTAQELAAGQIPPGLHYRLPTEAEWEYAARAGSTNRFSFGDDADYAQLGEYAWFIDNSNGEPHPVGLKKTNAWGLFDMSGNVWEWCQDWSASYPGGSATNPAGPAAGTERVVRGGSYYYDGWLSRNAARNSFRPSTRSPQIGFRVVLAPE